MNSHHIRTSTFALDLQDNSVNIYVDIPSRLLPRNQQRNMAEPQPPTTTEGADDTAAPPPTSAEDRKTAAAMNALESRAADNDDEEEGKKPTKQIDTEALNKAISRLELADKARKVAAGGEDPREEGRRRKKEEEQRERERRSKIKVDQAEVAVLVEELDLSKAKAVELLRAHEGDFGVALRAFVRAGA